MGQIKDELNKKYGRLTVVEYCGIKNNSAMWKCVCDCGNECVVSGISLRFGHTKSCGCIQKELLLNRNTKYINIPRRLYQIWYGIIERCTVPNSKNYKNYGARGISVCEEWKNPNIFFEWAFQNGYKDNLTIDRIENNGNYEPSNCRWSTMKTQQNNKRNNKKVCICGEEKTISQWCEIFGINRSTVFVRIHNGWDEIEAITTPTEKPKSVVCLETGEVFENARQAGDKYGVTKSSISMAASGKTKTSCGYHWRYAILEEK